MTGYIPPMPAKQKAKTGLLKRWWISRRCMLAAMPEKSYSMKLGQVQVPFGNVYPVCEMSLVRRILVDEWESFPKNRFLHRALAPLIGDSVISSSGELWKRQRRMIDPAFEQAGLKAVFPLMNDAVDAMHSRLNAVAGRGPVKIDEEMAHVTADTIFRTIFSKPLESADAKAVFDVFLKFQRAAASQWFFGISGMPGWLSPSFFKVHRYGKRIRKLLEPLVRSRFDAFHAGEPDARQDILASLLKVTDPDTGHVFTFDELVDQIATLFLAGHETTAGALGWSAYLIANCPDVQERMHDEAVSAFGDGSPAFADIKKLKVARDVFREALRLYPSIPYVARENTCPVTMRKKEIAPVSTLSVVLWLIHRHRNYWTKPDEFDPDRYKTAEGKESMRCAYIPFGQGPRVCLGAGFAMQESVLILASLARHYKLEPIQSKQPVPIGQITVRAENGIYVNVHRR